MDGSTGKLTSLNHIEETFVAPNFYLEAIYQFALVGITIGQVLNYNFNVYPNVDFSV